MTKYDLVSLNLPKLSGTGLSMFASAMENPLFRPLVLGNLLENGGIPKLRKMIFGEPPTYTPLCIRSEENGQSAPLLTWEELIRTAPPNIPHPTIRDFAEAYRRGKTTPLEVTEHILSAIQASQQGPIPLNALIATDREDLIKQARMSAQRLKEGRPLSLLDGVPIAVKDEIDQMPFPTTVGTRFLGKKPAERDSTVVKRLRASGALLIGKANMHEIGINPNGANAFHRRVANPYDLRRDTGGSSSGSAAAVAAGLCPVAIGADGGGSIRIPASLCGIVGLKPTFGRVSEFGAFPLCWSVAHLGPLGCCVEDTALTYAVISGADDKDPNSLYQPPVKLDGWNSDHLAGVRLGIYRQ
ncbi:MAG: amidase, partial [Anaerolineales bacterium]